MQRYMANVVRRPRLENCNFHNLFIGSVIESGSGCVILEYWRKHAHSRSEGSTIHTYGTHTPAVAANVAVIKSLNEASD